MAAVSLGHDPGTAGPQGAGGKKGGAGGGGGGGVAAAEIAGQKKKKCRRPSHGLVGTI